MAVIGLDAGGTKTVCYLADDDGALIAEARGPGAHLTAEGIGGVEPTLRDVIGQVLSGRSRELSGICLGMASVDRPGEAAMIRSLVEEIVVSPHVAIVNDALVALEAGAPGEPGIVVIAGTGSIAYGRNREGRAARAGGWGYVIADEGSGYWLGRQALRAAMRHVDGRGPATSLTGRLMDYYEVDQAPELVRKVYAGGLKPSSIAALAAIVQVAADDGDAVSVQIIDVGAMELAVSVSSVASRLQLTECTVVLAGGIFRAVPRMHASVGSQLASRLPGARPALLDVEPAMGAVRLALRVAAGEPVVPTYLDSPA